VCGLCRSCRRHACELMYSIPEGLTARVFMPNCAPLAISNSHIQQLLPCASTCTGEIFSCTTLWCMCVRQVVLVVCVLSDVLVAHSVRAVSSAPNVLVEQSMGVLLCGWTCRFFTGSAGHYISLYSRYSMCTTHDLVNGMSCLPRQGTRGKYCGFCQLR
jgi:hypothetical protein